MAAEFGFPLLRVGLNPGLIEGLAVAVERVQFDETIHRVAAQILSLNLPIDAQRLFSIVGFARTHPRVSYALAGSFCRFLIDHYGLRRFKRLYRTGDFRDVYQKEMSALLAEWRRQLDRYRVGDEERLKAAALFKRPTLFGKECVRVIANLNAQTQSLYDKGDYEGALQSATLSLQFTISGEAVFLKMNSLLRLGEFHAAEEFAVQMLRDSTWGATLLALKLQLGDAQWAGGNPAQAERTYSELLRTHFSPTMDESLLLRLEVLRDPTLSSVLVPYFVGALPDSSRLALLHTAAERSTRTELMSYLLAREYAAQGKDRRAIELFRRFEKMPSDELELQRQLRVARLEYARGEFQRAKIHFWQSMNYTSSAALQVRIQEWLDRCDWMTNPPPVLSEQKHGELLSSRPEGERYRELIFAHFLDTFCHASATDIPEHNLDSPQFTNGALLQTDSSQLVGGHHENND
jgi:tetratricopeptide (TPR) repeat protein